MRGLKRLTAHRFEQIPEYPSDGTKSNPRDVTIDIPLTDSPSRAQNQPLGSGSNPATEVVDEKAGHGHDHVPSGPDINDATGKPADSPEDGTLNRMGRIYQAIYNFSIVTRYMIYVIPLGLLIAIPIIVGATAAKDAYIGGVHLYWFFTWIEVVWVSLWVCKILAKVIPYVFQYLCGIVSSGTRKYASMLRALETPITLVLWAVVCLVTFLPIMRYGVDNSSKVTSWETSIKNILFGLLVCSLIYLGEKVIIQFISISYHRKQFDSKIKESKRNVYLVGLLFEASRNMFPLYCKEFEDEDMIIFDPILAQGGAKGATKDSPLTPLRLLGRQVGQNVGRFGDKVTAAFGNVVSELTGKQVFNPTATHSAVVGALERKRCAAALARRIWMSFVVEGREALQLEDIVEVLGPGHQTEAEECFAALDKDGNGDISLDEMILTVTEFGRMRKSLNHSMHDVDQAIHVLDKLLFTVAFIIAVLVFISFVTTGAATVIAACATTLLSLSFVFMATAQEVLGSCVFLFVKHPFDIGDRVDISDKSYVVERISLLYSVLRNVSDHRLTQVPNNVLNGLWIDNLTRANAMHEQLSVPVAFDTSFAEIQALREEMEDFVRDKDNSRDFQPDIDVEVIGVGDLDKLELRVDIRHKSNWSNETVRAARRSKFMCALVLAMRKIPIRGPGAAAPEETKPEDGEDDDNATSQGDDSDSKRDDSDAKAAAATTDTMNTDTLAPNTAQTSGFDSANGSTGIVSQRISAIQREAAIAERLNTRPPTMDIARDDRDAGLYRTATASSNKDNRSSVHASSTITRGLSTGHRKAGTHVSYHEDAPPVPPAPLSPVQAGMTPSSSGVPILNNPKPGSRGSARYEPPNQPVETATTNPLPEQPPTLPIIGSPESGTFHPYYNQDNPYDPVSVSGFSNVPNTAQSAGAPYSGLTASSQYEMNDRYDPVSPPFMYSPQWQAQLPPQTPAPAATAPSPQLSTQPENLRRQRLSFISRMKRVKESKDA